VWTNIILLSVGVFLWYIVAPEHFTHTLYGFFGKLVEMVKAFLVISVVILGMLYMFGWRPPWARKPKKGGH